MSMLIDRLILLSRALHYSAFFGLGDHCRLLLAADADGHAKDKSGASALQMAVYQVPPAR